MLTADRISLNTATVRAQWNLAQCIEGCQRHGIGGIAPWRDKLQEMGAVQAGKAIRAAGLEVSGAPESLLFARRIDVQTWAPRTVYRPVASAR